MEGKNERFSYARLLTSFQRGAPISLRDLNRIGVQPTHAAKLAERGLLQRLGQGTYLLAGDEVNRESAIAYLRRDNPGLHVGAKTALAWRGVRHNLAAGSESLSLWSLRKMKLPAWFIDRFPARVQTTALFDTKLPPSTGLQPLPDGRPDVLVSVPERALLEMLSDVGKTQSLEEARHLVENLTGVRAQVLTLLLKHTKRIKVVRLAEQLARDAGHDWASIASRQAKRLGGGRWVAKGRTGDLIDLRPKK